MRTVVPALLSAILCASSIAAAAEPSAIDYSAPPTCPDRDAFLAELRARTAEFSESRSASRKFIVRLAVEREGRARGSLALERSGRAGAPRTLEAKSCLEAARAISFLLALVLDPDARPPPSANEDLTRPPLNDDVNTAPLDAPVESESATVAASSTIATAPDKPPSQPSNEASRRTWLHLHAGLSVDVVGLAVPGPVLGGGVFVALRPANRLELRASLHQTLPSTVTVAGTNSSFAWTYGRVESCFDVLRAGRLEVGPCLHFDLGRIAAEGGGVARTDTPSRLWLLGGLSALARLVVLEPLVLELSVGLFAPLDRTDFAYRPAFVVYRPPAVGTQASIGAGVRWH